MKNLLLIMFATLIAGGVGAQNENMKRAMLFTLDANEKIHYNEYFASQHLHQNRFICIVENTRDETQTLVVNGKRLQTVKAVYETDGAGNRYFPYYPINVFYFDPAKENGYGYSYTLAGRNFVNVGGKVLPNVNASPYSSDDFKMTKSGKFTFNYYADGGGYVYADGKTFGPYAGIASFAISENGNYAYVYRDKDDRYHLIVNGTEKTLEPYRISYSSQVSIADDGGYAVRFQDSRTHYINVDGKIFGPNGNIHHLAIADNNHYAYAYNDEYQKCYVIIDGKKWGPFANVTNYSENDIIVTNNGKYAFRHYGEKYRTDRDNHYVNINGKTFGPYKNNIDNMDITDDGDYFFTYNEGYADKKHTIYNGDYVDKNIVAIASNGKMAYYYKGKDSLIINGKTYEKIRIPRDISITNSGQYGFLYFGRDSKDYANINGKIWGPYENARNLKITGNGKYAFLYKEGANWYVNIDGEIFGPYKDIHSGKIQISNDGKYLFRYKGDDDKYHVQTNIDFDGKDVLEAKLSDNGKIIFSYRDSRTEYVAVNEKIYGPYKEVRNVKINSKESFRFEYRQEEAGEWRYNVSGKDNISEKYFENIPSSSDDTHFYWIHSYSGSYEYYEGSIELTSPDNQHLFFSNYAYEYVVIDGQAIGYSPAVNAWYNEKNRSFAWSAIEDKDLVVYEYKLD
ncbi:MAG: hypothetical protein LBL90_04800 [Prevotellaceae bacterium]|jgi:hypothetical protein|nr:hypothetical protein [Prevotellaceae bacterium]